APQARTASTAPSDTVARTPRASARDMSATDVRTDAAAVTDLAWPTVPTEAPSSPATATSVGESTTRSAWDAIVASTSGRRALRPAATGPSLHRREAAHQGQSPRCVVPARVPGSVGWHSGTHAVSMRPGAARTGRWRTETEEAQHDGHRAARHRRRRRRRGRAQRPAAPSADAAEQVRAGPRPALRQRLRWGGPPRGPRVPRRPRRLPHRRPAPVGAGPAPGAAD